MKKIPNITNRSRLARVGVIRLGVRDQNGRGVEVGHFILDIEDSALAIKACELCGDKPTELDIEFYSDNLDEFFRCTFQKWGRSGNGKSLLECEGNGREAVAMGKRLPCPCPSLGRACRKTTRLNFLIPGITKSGFFRLVTKSEHSTEQIETTLRRAAGLLNRHFKLQRTEGYAEIRPGVKERKFYVSLILAPAGEPESAGGHRHTGGPAGGGFGEAAGPVQGAIDDFKSMKEGLERLISPSLEEDFIEKRHQAQRLETGRKRVKEKVKQFFINPRAEFALEQYACRRFGKLTFDDLNIKELLDLWHALGEDPQAVRDIHELLIFE